MRTRFGEWHYQGGDGLEPALAFPNGYWVPLMEIRCANDAERWASQISVKRWGTPDVVAALNEAMRDWLADKAA